MMNKKRSAEKTVRDIRRATRRHYSAEEKIRIVLDEEMVPRGGIEPVRVRHRHGDFQKKQ